MFSGIQEKINKAKKLSLEERAELKESILYHTQTIRNYMNENNVPIAVRNALEDRMIILNESLMKL